jgi:pimeloyl-ACP methyl ester carboxylesterase
MTGLSVFLSVIIALVGFFAVSALVNAKLAKKAERDNPPAGNFIDVGGTRIHYVERGQGESLVLLHGNGSMIQDFEASGLISLASKHVRVIAFDRPGFGHTERPRQRIWSPEAQAQLFAAALQQIGVSRAIVFGHSWGTSVAVALGLKYPGLVRGLVLASGYYYPTPRPDVLLLSVPAIPILGDVIRYSISPIISRLMWPRLVRTIFAPAPIPAKFEGFPKEMAFRPSQLRAAAAESAMLIPNAYAAAAHYKQLAMPVVIIAGEEDHLVDIESQSAQLHREITQSVMHRIPRTGHIVYQTATEKVMDAIDEAAGARADYSSEHVSSITMAREKRAAPARRSTRRT